MSELQEKKFVGFVHFLFHDTHPEYSDGMQGGFVNFAAQATDVSWAVVHVCALLAESNLIPAGFGHVTDLRFLDRLPTEDESALLSDLDANNDTIFGGFHVYPADE